MNNSKSNLHIEIVVSTMNRTSLSFLEPMFIENDIDKYQILVINQTQIVPLISTKSNIRVINSLEKSLPKSRNLAIKNAQGDICLISDDDVVYRKNFETDILEAFRTYPSADMITFQMTDEEGTLYNDYPVIIKHTKKTVLTVNSVVICFDRKSVVDNGVLFNDYFGLGATFPIANEYVFLRNALLKKLKLYYYPKILLSHPKFSSGRDSGNEKIIFARAALFYKYSGFLGYFRLFKYLWFYHNKGEINSNELVPKWKVGLEGIKLYKNLVKQKKKIK